MKKISFCITACNNEKDYVLGLLRSLVDNTEFEKHEILILIDSDNQNMYEAFLDYRKDKPNIKIFKNESHRLGYQKNISILFSKATNDLVVYLQADMVVGLEFDKYFLEALDKDKTKIITFARIEPPIHPESGEKITKSFGLTPDEFQYEEFLKFSKELQNENRPFLSNHFAPFGLYKESYFKYMGGFDTRFRVSREDSDFIIRIAASGLIPIETWNAHVYHYTCVSSRGKGWYKKDNEEIRLINEWQSAGDGEELKRFVRKWGYFGHDYFPKYNSSLVINSNCVPNIQILEAVEPYFDKIVINDKYVLDQLFHSVDFKYYYAANHRQGYDNDKGDELKHRFNKSDKLKDRFVFLDDYEGKDDIIIKTDLSELQKNFQTKETSEFIQKSNIILSSLLNGENSPKGKYKIGCFDVEVKRLKDTNKKHIDSSQYIFNTDEFIFN